MIFAENFLNKVAQFSAKLPGYIPPNDIATGHSYCNSKMLVAAYKQVIDAQKACNTTLGKKWAMPANRLVFVFHTKKLKVKDSLFFTFIPPLKNCSLTCLATFKSSRVNDASQIEPLLFRQNGGTLFRLVL